MRKKILIYGGGTFSPVRTHLALAAPAFGKTARRLAQLCYERMPEMETYLHLTKMADPTSELVTNREVGTHVLNLKEDFNTKIVFFNVALCDYMGRIGEEESGPHAPRLKTREGIQTMELLPAMKVLDDIRNGRKDIFLVAFKTTSGATEDEQYIEALTLMKRSSCNLVLANDTSTRVNMIVTPEEARYHVTTDRDQILRQLVDMTFHRSQLSFTHSTVVEGIPVKWDSEEVYPALRAVVNYCIEKNAYKPFNGATVGHFACKTGDREFLTSIRKSNFNDLAKNGLVRILTDGTDSILAYGAKPSVGGQSQRIIFSDHPEYDCIVHFHCPKKSESNVPVVSQREYECGSHQCGENTSRGLKQFGNLSAVMLDQHGPNIVFHHSINPQEVIDFIELNFDLSAKTGGQVSLEKEKVYEEGPISVKT